MIYALEPEKFCPKCKIKGLKIKMHEYERLIPYAGKYKLEYYYKCPQCGWYERRKDED